MRVVHSAVQKQMHTLYQDHHHWLYIWFYKKLGNSADAADLAHDTFMRMLVRNQYVDLQQPKAYLTTIAKGIMVNRLQRQAIEKVYRGQLLALPIEEVPSPEQSYLIIETLVEINQLLNTLPIAVKQVFLCAQFDGMKYEEIAQHLNISLSTVKRHIKQAFKQCLSVIMSTDF